MADVKVFIAQNSCSVARVPSFIFDNVRRLNGV
jgi:hypothetical protein